MKDKKLNNLLSLDSFSAEEVLKKAKPTKRTDVAKDVLKEKKVEKTTEIVEESVTGKEVESEKMKGKEVVVDKSLNNLISFSDFSKNAPSTSSKKTKRTEVAKDVLEKKEECCDDEKEEEEPKKGLTAKQKKLPEGLQKAILKKQK